MDFELILLFEFHQEKRNTALIYPLQDCEYDYLVLWDFCILHLLFRLRQVQ